LYIGIHDESRNILGLKEDYSLDDIKNSDGFLLKLKNRMHQFLGEVDFQKCVTESRILHLDEGDVCVIKVVSASSPVILKFKGEPELYVRDGNQSSKYTNIQAFCDYWCDHICDNNS